MSTTESQVNPNAATTNSAAPQNADMNELVGFQTVEITATEKGPALPDPAVHGIVVNSAKLKEILTAINAGDKVSAEFDAAIAGRGKDGAAGPAFLVLSLFPIPRGNEVDSRKARKVYGAGRGTDLPFADPDNNRLQITSLMFAPIKKDEDDGASGKTGEAEKDLEDEAK